MTHLNITLKDQVYHHFIFLSRDRGFINLLNYWVDNIHKSNDLSYHFDDKNCLHIFKVYLKNS